MPQCIMGAMDVLIGGTQNALQHAFLIVTVVAIHRLILDVCVSKQKSLFKDF